MSVRSRRFAAPAACLALAAAGILAAGCREHGTPDPDIRMAISHEPQETATTATATAPGASGGTETADAPADPSAGIASGGGGAASGMGGGAQKVPTKLVVPPEVQKAFSGVKVRWKDATAGKEGVLEVPISGAAPIPDSDLVVHADVYLPAFTMTSEMITSSGIEEANQAARISVSRGNSEIFAGWIFTRFPEVHPFEHPRFSLRLEGGVRRPS